MEQLIEEYCVLCIVATMDMLYNYTIITDNIVIIYSILNMTTQKKRSAVTYDEIVHAYEKLENEGKTPSVRNIMAIVGGSPSTIQAGIAKYQSELEERNKIPEDANEVLLSLGQQIVGFIRKENEKQNIKLKNTIDELNETINSLRGEIDDLEIRAADDREEFRAMLKIKDNELAIANDREKRANDEMKKNQNALDKERENRHQAEIKIAAIEAELKTYQKLKSKK